MFDWPVIIVEALFVAYANGANDNFLKAWRRSSAAAQPIIERCFGG
jgi:hypothetical protein